jgi:sensor c-di-GMP phosphodiesterase-like protein
MRGRNERKLFRFLILLAKELGMRTVTEGVEDEVQIRLLKNLGAEEIQGWYYSKALPSFDCIEYIRKFRFTDDDTDDPNTFGANGSFSVVDTPKTEK